jgi:hypothetical protein
MTASPSKDPANDGTMAGVLSSVLNKFTQNTDDMLPAKIIAYDRKLNLATVQPLIAMLDTNSNKISRAVISRVPVLQIGGGGFMLNFNLKSGDLGWIKANDRDISLFVQSLSESRPNTLRKKSFEDAIFIPSIMRNYTIAGEDETHAVIQSLDGSVRISLWSDKVKITAPNGLLVDGDIESTGEIRAAGTVSSQIDVIGGGKSGVNHTHRDSIGGNTTAPL